MKSTRKNHITKKKSISLNKKRKSMNRRQMRSKRVANGKRKSMNRRQMRSKRKSMCGGSNSNSNNNSENNNNNELAKPTGVKIQRKKAITNNIFGIRKKKKERNSIIGFFTPFLI